MASRGFLGAGNLLISRYNTTSGLFEDYTGPYEVTKFEIKPNVEIKELTSRGRDTYGQVIESVTLMQPADFSISMPEVNREALTMAFLGTQTTLSQAAVTTATTQTVTNITPDVWYQLDHQNVTLSSVSTTSVNSGTTDLDDSVDYVINARLGMIKVLSTGRAVTGTGKSLMVTYTAAAITGADISGATSASVRAKFIFDGVNFADGLPVIVRVHEAIIAADAAFDFLSSDFASLDLKGRLKTPADKTMPFQVELRDA